MATTLTKPSQGPVPLRLRRNEKSWQTARITKVTNRRQAPQRDHEIEELWPGHIIPASPQMLEELLRRSLKLRTVKLRTADVHR